MNTKSALIIAVAIVIGFSIEPILDRVAPLNQSSEIQGIESKVSDPRKRVIKVWEGDSERPMFMEAGSVKWRNLLFLGSITGGLYPADKESAETVLEIYNLQD
jgi:hypothetical protein